MIVCDGLHKQFAVAGKRGGKARFTAVRSVSFQADDGQITGLLGPNGAGKSTTLRMIATLLKPDAGRALVDGHDVGGDVLAVRRQLGFMPHNAGIYPRLTARENILYYGRLCGLSAAAARTRSDELIRRLEMDDFAARRAQGFSQGQRTKVALARALVHRPQTVMLDEPTNGLDVMATRGLRKILRNLAGDGHCVVFSSHVMQEVAALCDHIAIIADGRIAMADTLPGILSSTGQDNLEDAFVRTLQKSADALSGDSSEAVSNQRASDLSGNASSAPR